MQAALQATPAPPEFYSNNHGVRTRMPLSVHGANGARSDLVILIDGHGRTRRMDLARPPGARYKYTPPSPATKSGRAHRSGVGAARTQSSLDVRAAISKPEIGRKATGASPRQHPSLFPPPAGSAAIRKAELQHLPCRPFHLSFFFERSVVFVGSLQGCTAGSIGSFSCSVSACFKRDDEHRARNTVGQLMSR